MRRWRSTGSIRFLRYGWCRSWSGCFGSLSKTLLFEYRSIEELAGYFHAEHRQRLSEQLGEVGGRGAAEPAPRTHVRALPVARRARRARAAGTASPGVSPPLRDIAVIGVSGRYPQAQDLEQFWENLKAGKDCITEIPKQRWDHDLYFDAQKGKSGKTYSKWGGFIEGIDQFDPLFFNISPRDAAFMDPHERLFLETTWNLLEGAGYTREKLQSAYRGEVGVYVGSMYHQYGSSFSGHSAIANRVSYFFGLEGPSLSIDTMCSSTLIALHTACEDLQSGACQLAIAGGVNLSVHPHKYVYLSQAQLIGSDATARSFGAGDGYQPSEAAGAVLLKPLARAIEANDRILGVIKGSAVNHSGRVNGYGVPSAAAQQRLISRTLAKARVRPRDIGYIEAAATGSPVGDSLEFVALSKIFTRDELGDHAACVIGSVKGALGHAEAASGMQQLTKVLLQLQHRQIVPTVMSGPVNSDIHFDATPLTLQRELSAWNEARSDAGGDSSTVPRRALINSFGAGGSNACVVIEEYLGPRPVPTIDPSPQIIVLSARTPLALLEVQRRLLAFLRAEPTTSLSDLAYTLQVGREHMSARVAFVVSHLDELARGLRNSLDSSLDTEADAGVPTFAAEEGGNPAIRDLTAGDTGDQVVELLAAHGSLERIAALWAHGARIDWTLLRRLTVPHLVALPTYPFQKRSYWWSDGAELRIATSHVADAQRAVVLPPPDPAAAASAESRVSQLIAHVLALAPQDVVPHAELRDLGMDSLGMLKLKRGLAQEFEIVLSGRDLLRHSTAASIAKLVNQRGREEKVMEPVAVPPSMSVDVRVEPMPEAPDAHAQVDFATDALEKFRSGTLNAAAIRELLMEGKIA